MTVSAINLEGGTAFLLQYPGASEYARLKIETPWIQRSLVVFGRRVKQPRLTAWYGDREALYTYSGITHRPIPWTPLLSEIRERVENLLEYRFNGALLNFYRNGRDSIGFHADDETVLGPEPVIASLSFGAKRIFVFRHRRGEHPDVEIELDDCSLLVMMGETQKNWHHGIDKCKDAEGRINLTFRHVLN